MYLLQRGTATAPWEQSVAGSLVLLCTSYTTQQKSPLCIGLSPASMNTTVAGMVEWLKIRCNLASQQSNILKRSTSSHLKLLNKLWQQRKFGNSICTFSTFFKLLKQHLCNKRKLGKTMQYTHNKELVTKWAPKFWRTWPNFKCCQRKKCQSTSFEIFLEEENLAILCGILLWYWTTVLPKEFTF